MIVSELIEWLKSQDQEAIVEVIVIGKSDYYNQAGTYSINEFTPELSDYSDFRNSEMSKGHPWENKRYLQLGGE